MNLAWTGPIDNTYISAKLSLGKVENVAADTFLRGLPTDGAAETAADSQEAAGDAETRPQSKPRRRAVETLSETARRPGQMPDTVEKGFEIPITIASPFVELEIGKFKRLGMDVVVNAVWSAYYWAKQEGSRQAVTALEKLILDWPFDYVHIQGNSTEDIEENKFKWTVNMTARVERLRDYVGLENSNLLRIVARAAELLQGRGERGGKPSPERVQPWLQENARWGLVHCPDVKTVKRHIDNWAALQRCPAALALLEASANRWGRDNLLDWPTKLGIIVQKTDPGSIGYVVEALYTRMWRMNQKGPYSANALGDVIAEILWARTYIASFLRKYPELLKLGCNSEASASTNEGASANQSVQMARARIDRPLQFFLQTEGPDKDPTWLQTLPTVALRLAMKHFLDLVQGFYRSEIAGVLRQPRTDRYNFDQFHRGWASVEAFLGALPDRAR